MVGFSPLAAVSAAGQGMIAGQDQTQQMLMRAKQIQQMQMLLDQAKKQVSAQIAYGNALGSGSGAPSPAGPSGAPTGAPPSPSGAPPSSPWSMTPPPGPNGVPTPTQKPPMPMQPQQPMGGAPPGGMTAPPQQNAAPQAPQGQPTGNPLQSLAQALNSGMMDPAAAIQAIATRIKTANPGIDPQTLEMAVEQAVGLLHQVGLDPATKLQMQLLLSQQKIAGQEEVTGMRTESAEKIAGERVAATERGQDIGAGSRERVAAGHDATSIANNQARISSMEKRLLIQQENINKRASGSLAQRVQSQAQNQRVKVLGQELSAAKAELSSASQSMDPDRIAAAQRKVDEVDKKLKILEKATGVGGAAPQDRGASVDKIHPDPSWPSAKDVADGSELKDAAGDVVARAKNGQWVPVTGLP